jgi:protein-disulfide isomerase
MHKILLAVGALLWVMSAPAAHAADKDVPTQAPDDRVLGKADAPITIFEYASLTCPHCAEFDVETLPKIKTEWIDTGKAKLIFRDYPLDQVALRAAMLARCAPPQQSFAFIDALFHDQANWVMASDQRESLEHLARLGGIGPDQFGQCMSDQKLADSVVAERLVAKDQYGVDSTPTFFINGTKFVGAQPYEAFEQALNAAAGEAAPAASTAAPPPVAAPPVAASTAATPAPSPTASPVSTPAPEEAPAAVPPPRSWMQRAVDKVKRMFGY